VIGIVVSRADAASERIGEQLLSIRNWSRRVDEAHPDARGGGDVFRTDGFELRTFEEIHLDVSAAAATFDDPEMLVFASRHAGDTGALLTAHFTGNFGPAEFGGDDHSLATACPNALSRVVEALDAHAPPSYDVGIECTHHGPSEVGAPSMFVELGSDEQQWDDPEGARAVARAILDLAGVAPNAAPRAGDAESSDVTDCPIRRHIVGIGGGHYAPRFTRIARETDWHVGHVAADWALDAMGSPEEHRDVIDEAFERSAADVALIDGDDGDHERVRAVIEDLGHRVVSETWLRETGAVPLSLVTRLEETLSPVDDGLRFGDPACEADTDPGAITVVDLPDDLLAAARSVDADSVREAVERAAYAFETSESGTRVGGRAVFPGDGAAADGTPAAYRGLVDTLANLLGEKYDTVERDGDRVRAETVAFDPERARDAGVPEGPAFGKLSNGQSVEVDGERIDPEDVRSLRREEFSL
jgi:D-aminoacyl-tRNA deacylase